MAAELFPLSSGAEHRQRRPVLCCAAIFFFSPEKATRGAYLADAAIARRGAVSMWVRTLGAPRRVLRFGRLSAARPRLQHRRPSLSPARAAPRGCAQRRPGKSVLRTIWIWRRAMPHSSPPSATPSEIFPGIVGAVVCGWLCIDTTGTYAECRGQRKLALGVGTGGIDEPAGHDHTTMPETVPKVLPMEVMNEAWRGARSR